MADDSQEGLDKINAVDPQIIFLEIHLPGHSGLELARQIKSNHPKAVIALFS